MLETEAEYPLICHPSTADRPGIGIRVRVLRTGSGILHLQYSMVGELQHLRVPAFSAKRRGNELWRHTCLEAFVAPGEAARYYEFNFSPSGEWASYVFTDYRTGMAAATGVTDLELRVATSQAKLQLSTSINTAPLAVPGREPLRLALAAVIESENGTLSYWALRHPVERPDFHHPDSFAITL